MQYEFEFAALTQAWPYLMRGTLVTIALSVGAMVIGLTIAILCSWALRDGPRPLRWLVTAYVEGIRNTPFIIQLFFVFFALPVLGVRLSADMAALATMSFNLGAYATEIVRAGIESIPRGLTEAGVALNLPRRKVFRHVILRPALNNIFPALTSQFILVMLDSSVLTAISGDDLASVAANLQSLTFQSFEIYFAVTGIYFVLSLSFMALFKLVWMRWLRYPGGRMNA